MATAAGRAGVERLLESDHEQQPGRPGRANEDFVGAVPGAVVLVDGAAAPGAEQACRHGADWYAQTLGAALLRLLSAGPATLAAPTVITRLAE